MAPIVGNESLALQNGVQRVLEELKHERFFLAKSPTLPSSTFLWIHNVTWATFVEFKRQFDSELEISKSLRISFLKDKLFVRSMPTLAHETGHRRLSKYIDTALIPLDPARQGGIDDVGSASFLQPNLASMEGDTVFVADTQPLSPRLVIEVGDSQSYESLKLKADGWFEYFPTVQAVIIVRLYDSLEEEEEVNKKEVVIELWERAPGGKTLYSKMTITPHTPATTALEIPVVWLLPQPFPEWIPAGQNSIIISAVQMQKYYDRLCLYIDNQ